VNENVRHDRTWLRVDASGVVSALAADWNAFVGRRFVGCLASASVGKPFRTLGGAAASVYDRLFDEARRHSPSSHDVWATAHDRLTKVELTVRRREGDVEIGLAPLFEREREQALPFFDLDAPRGDDAIRACGFCGRLYGFRWVEAETALRQLRVDRHALQPRLSPDVCLDCERQLTGTLRAAS
jgi:hypothetical protein